MPEPSSSPFCTARSKRTGERCKRRVPGGGVCRFHGGAARQVVARREARLVHAQVLREAAEARQDADSARDPAELLLVALGDADAVLGRIKARASAAAEVSSVDMAVLGEWVDRLARLAKMALDAGAVERSGRREEEIAAKAAEAAWETITGVLAELGHDVSDPQVQQALMSVLDPSPKAPA